MNQKRKEQIRKSLISFARAQFESSNVKAAAAAAATCTSSCHTSNPTSTSTSIPIEIVAPISPTPNALIQATFPKLNLSPSSHVVELGCGDARWIIAIAKKFSCQSCLGIDIDEERLELARRNIRMEMEDKDNGKGGKGLENTRIEVRNEDVFEYLRHHLYVREDAGAGVGVGVGVGTDADGDILQQNNQHRDHISSSPRPHPYRNQKSKPNFNSNPDLIVLYLFREAMKKISRILKEKGFVGTKISSSSSASNMNSENGENEHLHVVQILCIGFMLPGFAPSWYDQVDGIKAYLYHVVGALSCTSTSATKRETGT